MKSKLAGESRRQLIEDAKRLTREERLEAFVRLNRLVTKASTVHRRARRMSSGVKG